MKPLTLLISLISLFLLGGCPPLIDIPFTNIPFPKDGKRINAVVGYPLFLEAKQGSVSEGKTPRWYKDGVVMERQQHYWILEIDTFRASDSGIYAFGRQKNLLDTFNVQVQNIKKNSVGTEYLSNQAVVKFAPDAPDYRRDSFRQVFGATVLDSSCMCDLELWHVDDTIDIEIENRNEEITSTADPEGIDRLERNFLINHDTEFKPNGAGKGEPATYPNTPNVLVAIIDTGIDTTHIDFAGKIWHNENNLGGDENCLKDGFYGYDFYNDDEDPLEKALWHGTHVAGLVNKYSKGQAKFLTIKAFGSQPLSSLNKVICSVNHAKLKNAKVINCSFGWFKTPSDILEQIMIDAGNSCGALFVCSAGNKAQNNRDTLHFPSGYSLNNILEVTSLKGASTEIEDYANFGSSIDLAVQGNLPSTMPGNSYARHSGTSMSAGVASGIAASIFANDPTASWFDVRTCILGSGIRIPFIDITTIKDPHWGISLGEITNADFLSPDISCVTNNKQARGDGCPPSKGVIVLMHTAPMDLPPLKSQ